MNLNAILEEMELTPLHYFALLVLGSSNLVVAFNHIITGLLVADTKYGCKLQPHGNATVSNVSVAAVNETLSNETCPYGYEYFPKLDSEVNIVMEWDLVGDRRPLCYHAVTVYFCGVAIGVVVFGLLSDRFGRRKMVIVSLLATVVLALGTSYVPNYVGYLVIRFFSGFFLQGMDMCNYCMMMEIVPAKKRPLFAALMEVNWCLGTIYAGVLGLLIRNWRWILLAGNSLNVLTVLVYLCILPESIRWLINNGRFAEAERHFYHYVSKTTPKFHGKKLMDLLDHDEFLLHAKTRYNFTHLFRAASIRKYTLCLGFIWLATTLNFWGIVFGSIELGPNAYVSTIIGGAFEIVPLIACRFVLKRFGRRWPMMVYLMASGISVLVAGFLPLDIANGWIPNSVLLFARMANVGSFTIIYIFTAELFPTNIRNIGMSYGGFWSRIGELSSPEILHLSDIYYPSTFIIFGAVNIIASVVCYPLPETKGKHLPDTIEEAENLMNGKTPIQMESGHELSDDGKFCNDGTCYNAAGQ